MGSRTRFFGTVLAMLALNTFYFRPSEPTDSTEPSESETEQQIDSPPESSQSRLPALEQVANHWSQWSRSLTSFWHTSSTSDLQPQQE